MEDKQNFKMKKSIKKSRKIAKGMPSAVLLSILIHAMLFLLAGMLIVFTVVKTEEKKFIPVKAIERPKMKLRKPKVRVKKSTKPKSSMRIVTKVKRANMPDIQLPEMSSLSEGFSDGIGGFDVMPDFDSVSAFGSGHTIGNDFVGTFYDFKQDRKGRPITYSADEYRVATRKFMKGGWKVSSLARFYKSPKKRYATCFMVPPAPSSLVPALFGEPDIEGTFWLTHYKGQLVHQEGITFRFMGWGDGTIAVRVDGKISVLAGWLEQEGQFWRSTTGENLKYGVANGWFVTGDWITLEPGVPLSMEVMMVEGGGVGSFMLAIQEKGVKYEKRPKGNGEIFPAFKTTVLSRDLLDAIYKDLVPEEVSLTNGPVFCDYGVVTGVETNTLGKTDSPEAAPPKPEVASALRSWTGLDGKTLEAEYLMVMGDRVVLKTAKGKQKKIPLAQLSGEDREYIELSNPPELKIDFSAKTKQVFSIIQGSPSGETVGYDYYAKVRLKQMSAGKYNHELCIECFSIGKEITGDRYVLLDRKKSYFTPTTENKRAHEFSGEMTRLQDFLIYRYGTEHRGQKPYGYLITVTDSQGKIIQHEESNEWLHENIENLKRLPTGAYMDRNCIRTFPTSPKSPSSENVWGKY